MFPVRTWASDSNAGAVQLFSSNNVTITPGANLTQDTAGVGGAGEPGDLFGDQVAFAAPGSGTLRPDWR